MERGKEERVSLGRVREKGQSWSRPERKGDRLSQISPLPQAEWEKEKKTWAEVRKTTGLNPESLNYPPQEPTK